VEPIAIFTDPKAYTDPERWHAVLPRPGDARLLHHRGDRGARHDLAFGTGVHFCLGANLARLELAAFFRELLPRLDAIELCGPTEYTAATFVGAPKRVPIRYRLSR